MPVKSVPAIEVGVVLEGRYRIVRPLGEGGMGAVYEAEHASLGRRVAIKVLHAHVAQMADAVQRFSREARAAAEVGHPNIVEVFDTGTHHGQPFLVMELLRGESLADRLARPEAVSPDESCKIIGHVLSALASAHAKGIIHRDLKPENLYLGAADARSPVKLLDFGVSKFRRSGQTLLQTTQEGVPLGTPAYMAPEQWMGRKDIDHRADIFAVGVMLYELLTGCLPYEGANQGELFLEIVRGTTVPDAPSSLEREIPAALDRVVLRALDRDRDQRYSSAVDFLEALRPFGADAVVLVDGPPAAPARDTTPPPARRALRNAITFVPPPRLLRPEVLGAAAVVALTLGLGAWWLSRVGRSESIAPPTVARAHPRPTPTPPMPATHAAGRATPAPAPIAASPIAAAPVAPPVNEPAPSPRRARARSVRAPSVAGATSAGVDRLPVSQEFKP